MHASFGSVSADGGIENPGSGDWIVEKGALGRYTIVLETTSSPPPVVVATGSVTGDDQATDNVVTVAVRSGGQFTVMSRDVAGLHENEPQDAAFSFVAIWP